MTQTTYSNLLDKYLSGTLTSIEKEQLLNLLDDQEQREQVLKLIEVDLQQDRYEASDDPEIRQLIHRYLDANIAETTISRRIPAFVKYAAAAMLVISAGLAWYWWSGDKKTDAIVQTERFKNDIDPAQPAVQLTLGDGSVMLLEQQANGAIGNEGGTALMKQGEQLSYQQQQNAQAVLYNQVATAKGSQYQIVLADGTKVWLNAASSLRFPTSFPGTARVVELTGEGYFEVAKSATQPFRVKVAGSLINVLGTSFNVRAYSDEEGSRITLIEGKVKVNEQLLNPGQLASVNENGNVQLSTANIDENISWKQGMFRFDNRPISSIMREIERWYDVKVEYKGNVAQRLTSIQPRNIPVSKLLKTLEMTDAVRFEIDGKKITVMNVSPR